VVRSQGQRELRFSCCERPKPSVKRGPAVCPELAVVSRQLVQCNTCMYVAAMNLSSWPGTLRHGSSCNWTITVYQPVFVVEPQRAFCDRCVLTQYGCDRVWSKCMTSKIFYLERSQKVWRYQVQVSNFAEIECSSNEIFRQICVAC
jgi:hypothetical protein